MILIFKIFKYIFNFLFFFKFILFEKFNNIHECYKNGDCSSFKELSEDKTDFGIIVLKETEMNPNFNFKNNVFNEIYGSNYF